MPIADTRPWHAALARAWEEATQDGGEPPHPAFARRDELHGPFADWLEDRGDPRATLVRKRYTFHGPSPVQEAYQTASRSAFGDGYTIPHRTKSPVSLSDGTSLHITRYYGRGKGHSVVNWRVGGDSPGYTAVLPDKDLIDVISGLGPKDKNRVVRGLKHTGRKDKRPLPWKQARDRATGAAGSIRDAGSANHAARIAIARHVLREAGLDPATVRAAVHHDGKKARAAVVQVIHNSPDPARLKYAAAWYGLLSSAPALTVFHPAPDGEDALHVIHSPHPTEHISAYLSAAGVPSFTVEARPQGSRAYVYDPGTTQSQRIVDAARGLDASHSAISGTGVKLGGRTGPAAAAGAADRAAYRTAVEDYERA